MLVDSFFWVELLQTFDRVLNNILVKFRVQFQMRRTSFVLPSWPILFCQICHSLLTRKGSDKTSKMQPGLWKDQRGLHQTFIILLTSPRFGYNHGQIQIASRPRMSSFDKTCVKVLSHSCIFRHSKISHETTQKRVNQMFVSCIDLGHMSMTQMINK